MKRSFTSNTSERVGDRREPCGTENVYKFRSKTLTVCKSKNRSPKRKLEIKEQRRKGQKPSESRALEKQKDHQQTALFQNPY